MSIHIRSSKFSVYFTRKNLFFLFYTITCINHLHQFIYFTRYFNKIFILLNFFIISHHYHFNTYARALSFITHFTDHLSLSLSLSLSHSFSKTTGSLSFFFILHRVLSSLANLGPFFTSRSKSFLHQPIHEPSSTTQILSSPADPRTKLQDPNPFFIGRSTNQAPRPRSLLHWPIHEPSSPTQITSSPTNPRTKLQRPISFLHRLIHEPSSMTQILSSLTDPRTKLPKHRSISLLVCLCGFVCV